MKRVANALKISLLALAVSACAPRPRHIPFTDWVCETRTEGRMEGVATVERRPALAAPLVAVGHARFVQRAIWHGVGGTATLLCSRPATGPNRCVLSAESEDGYGFGAWALSTVPELDIPSRPDASPVRVEFVFTLTERRTYSC